MASNDMVSLFINVPPEDTNKIIANHNYSDTSHPPIKKDDFIKLLKLATEGIFLFLYDNKTYRQTDGVTMRFPLGPTLANFFLANLK